MKAGEHRYTSQSSEAVVDEAYMKRALKLAKKGEGWTSPNPMVGAVIVKEGRIIGEGYHRRFGRSHGEINAINNASESVEGSTLYVTLEPCSHQGKTPPCVDRIIAEKFARVVAGIADPNPLVSGRGIKALERNGIETTVGVLEGACRALNEKFFKFMETRIPYITLKYAQTIDGRIATSTGHSMWISSISSRKFVHRLRSQHDGILVGIGTVIKDDPELTVRLVRGRNPLRIIVDPLLNIPWDARVLEDRESSKTIIATTNRSLVVTRDLLAGRGIETIVIDEDDENRISLKKLFAELGRRGISSLLVEGGSKIITSLIREKIPDRVLVITAPKIAGSGIEAVGDLGIRKMDDSIRLVYKKIFRKGDDIVIDARIQK